MATFYAILAFVLAGAAIGFGWNLGGQLAAAASKWNKKPWAAAAVIIVIVFIAVLMNRIPMPF